MKYFGFLLIIGSMAFSACNSGNTVAKPDMATEADTFSYYYGVLVGKGVQQDVRKTVAGANMDALKYGLMQSFDEDLEIDREEMESYVQRIMDREDSKKKKEQRQQQAAQAQLMLDQYKSTAEEHKTEIDALEAWIKANRNFDEVVKAPEGYFYREVTPGNGNKPTVVDEVEVHYTGTLLNGSKFDSSHDRGQPAVFPLMRVIPGWTLGLQQMSVGSTYELFIPAHLAYGEIDRDGIPANSPLVFTVQLLSIVGQ